MLGQYLGLDELSGFTQGVSARGYEWADEGPNLSALSLPVKFYNPFRTPNLFLRFAELHTDTAMPGTDRARILRFANKYGLLGAIEWSDEGLRRTTELDSLAVWLEQIRLMAECVTLLKTTLRAKEFEPVAINTLRELVVNKHGKCMVHRGGGRYSLGGRELAQEMTDADVRTTALALMSSKCNQQLREYAYPVVCSKNTMSDSLAYRFTARCLLGAMWLQFAYHLVGGRSLKTCACGKLFEVGPGVRRSDAEWCADDCRTNTWKREQRARRKAAAQTDADQ